MRSIRYLLPLVAASCVALSASAQIYQWKDQNGKTVISDKPPIGQVQQQKQTDSGAPESGPRQPSLADREMEFRKRRKEAQEKAEKAQEEERAAARKNENCQNARRQLRALESGERMSLRGDDGERHYLDDAQRGQEAAKMRQIIENQCPE